MKKLLNPIEFFDDKKLLITNLIIFAIGMVVATLMRAVFGSPIEFHFLSEIEVSQTILSNLYAIGIMTFVLFISGKIINSKTRFIDCLNLSLYLRIPYYFLRLWIFKEILTILISNFLIKTIFRKLL